MKSRFIISGALLVATLVLGTQTAYAWHPVGVISKTVQNVTAKGEAVEADSAATAVEVKTGDVLKYTITVRNDGQQSRRDYNDLAFIKVTDELPAGVELVTDPELRTISYEVDNLKPGESSSKSYEVKVTSTTNSDVLTNQACFVGDSTVKDNKQEGCDDAVVKLNIPQTSSTSVTVTPPVVKAVTTTLPKTGMNNVFIVGVLAGILAYAGSLFKSRRSDSV